MTEYTRQKVSFRNISGNYLTIDRLSRNEYE
jgi:hypothetical protein